MKSTSIISILCILSFISEADGQAKYPPLIDGAKEITYKTVEGVKLNLWVFSPQDHKPDSNAPAIIFFFGGGWVAEIEILHRKRVTMDSFK